MPTASSTKPSHSTPRPNTTLRRGRLVYGAAGAGPTSVESHPTHVQPHVDTDASRSSPASARQTRGDLSVLVGLRSDAVAGCASREGTAGSVMLVCTNTIRHETVRGRTTDEALDTGPSGLHTRSGRPPGGVGSCGSGEQAENGARYARCIVRSGVPRRTTRTTRDPRSRHPRPGEHARPGSGSLRRERFSCCSVSRRPRRTQHDRIRNTRSRCATVRTATRTPT